MRFRHTFQIKPWGARRYVVQIRTHWRSIPIWETYIHVNKDDTEGNVMFAAKFESVDHALDAIEHLIWFNAWCRVRYRQVERHEAKPSITIPPWPKRETTCSQELT